MNLPGTTASRSPFARPVAMAAGTATTSARDVTPVGSASAKHDSPPFGVLLGAILATNGTASSPTGSSGEGQPDSDLTNDVFVLLGGPGAGGPTMPTAPVLTDAEMAAAGLAASAAGAAGLAAMAGGSTEAVTSATDIVSEAGSATADKVGTVAGDSPSATSSAMAAVLPGATPSPELEGVAPELRERVQRVVERMRDELGIDIRVTEGLRTQARQDALHAQGRSTPGPVVTWTRNSRHTLGRAVDVTVNGGYSDTSGFAALQRIAREEGLHTLGMRDPGHLELPASVAGQARTSAGAIDLAALAQLASDAGARMDSLDVNMGMDHDAPSARLANTRGVGATDTAIAPNAASARPVTGVARVATVASVAHVASVAQVARVAMPGTRSARGVTAASDRAQVQAIATDTRRVARAATTAQPSTASSEVAGAPNGTNSSATTANSVTAGTVPSIAGSGAPIAAAQVAAANGQGTPRQRADSMADEKSGASADTGTGDADGNVIFGADGGRGHEGSPSASRVAPASGTLAPDALSRLDRIDALRDGSAARPLSHLTLTMDNDAGGSDRIRVDVRGSQLGAVLELGDPVLRDRVSSRLGELQHALEQRGLQSDGLQVRRTGLGAVDGVDMSRIAGATLERDTVRAGGSANSGQSFAQQRERDGRHPSDGPPDDSSHRQRPRREPKENQK